MVRNLIIQIFLGEEEKLEDFPKFVMNKNRWESYCDKMGFQYLFFDRYNIQKYLGVHEKFYYSLEFTWQRIDFIRYLILNQEGGLYFDMDTYPNPDMDLKELLDQRYILNYWTNPKNNIPEVNNAIMGVEPGDFDDLIQFSISETERLRMIKIYRCWKIRFMKRSTGVCMFKKWCKKKKMSYTPCLHEYVTDEMTCSWIKNFH